MDTRADLLQRIERAPPEAWTHGNKLETVLVGVSDLFGADLGEEVRSLVPAPSPGTFNHPTADLLNLCDVSALTIERRLGHSYAEVLEQLGLFTIRGFFSSSLGRGLWQMASLEAPAALARSLASLRSVYTHGQRRFESRGANSAVLIFREELMGPAWMRGVYRGGTEYMPRRLQFSTEHVSDSGLSFALRFDW